MHATSEFSGRENVASGRASVLGKGILAEKSKTRGLAEIKNSVKPVNIEEKTRAAERQRANAAKLSRGFSVVHSARASVCEDKENEKSENFVKPRTTDVRKEKSIFKAPVLNAKPKKFTVNDRITKSASVTSLVSLPVKAVESSSAVNLEPAAFEVDCDPKRVNNELHLSLYARDIYNYLRELEINQTVREGYLNPKYIMTEEMRCVLVDWMYEVKESLQLLVDTVQIAIAILDLFMQRNPKVPKDELQLVGISCIFVASKYEEMFHPCLDDCVKICADACSAKQIKNMERRILKTLNFNLGRAPPIQFLRRFCYVGGVCNEAYVFSKYFVDTALIKYAFCHIPPSQLAASAICLSMFVMSEETTLTEKLWGKMSYYTGYSFSSIENIVPKLAKLIFLAPNCKQQVVRKVYSDPKKYIGVSMKSDLSSKKLRALAMTTVQGVTSK